MAASSTRRRRARAMRSRRDVGERASSSPRRRAREAARRRRNASFLYGSSTSSASSLTLGRRARAGALARERRGRRRSFFEADGRPPARTEQARRGEHLFSRPRRASAAKLVVRSRRVGRRRPRARPPEPRGGARRAGRDELKLGSTSCSCAAARTRPGRARALRAGRRVPIAPSPRLVAIAHGALLLDYP